MTIGTGGRGSLENFRARRRAFRALHEAGCFVIPNPWDVGSARYLQQLGFSALATTSAGFAFSQGLPDSEGALTCERNLAYIADIAGAVDIPVNADFASGYGASPQDVNPEVIQDWPRALIHYRNLVQEGKSQAAGAATGRNS
jgi:2-methylisocitrate lyase-like PEP mutase family enzyme